MNNNLADFEKALNDIRLCDFIDSHKEYFKFNSKKSSHRHIVFDELSTGEKIIVSKKNTNKELYFTSPSDEKGDLITFIKNRIDLFNSSRGKNEWIRISEVINSFRPGLHKFDYDIKVHTNNPSTFQLSYYHAVPLHDFTYLNSRNIKTAFLKHKLFENRIFNNNYKGDVNTLFPFFHEKEIRGVSIRGTNVPEGKKNGNNSDLTYSIWHSNYDPTKPIDNIIMGESPIDAISYAQLKYFDTNNMDKNILLTSIDGSVREYLNHFIHQLPKDHDTKFTLVNDNDVAGYIHDLRIIKTFDPTFPITPIYINPKAETLQFKQTYANDIEFIHKIKNDTQSMFEFFKYKIGNQIFKRNIAIDKPPLHKDWNLHLCQIPNYSINNPEKSEDIISDQNIKNNNSIKI